MIRQGELAVPSDHTHNKGDTKAEITYLQTGGNHKSSHANLSQSMAMRDILVHSAHVLSKNHKEPDSVLLFDHKMLGFQFRDKEIRKG